VELNRQRSHCPTFTLYTSEYGAKVEWYWQGNRRSRRKTYPSATLSTAQMPHGLTLARTWVSAKRSRRLSTSATARPEDKYLRHLQAAVNSGVMKDGSGLGSRLQQS
jgi:hypothetical protein